MNQQAEPRTRARWLGVVLILTALLALGWQAWEAGLADELPLTQAPAPVVKMPSLGALPGNVDFARLGMQAASGASPAGMDGRFPLARDETEICGLGRVKATDSGEPKDMQPIRLAAQRARERVIPLLAQSADEVARAAALLLKSIGQPPAADEACERADCVRSASAAAPALTDARLRIDLVSRDALASLALNTRSAQVYAMAMGSCHRHRNEGVCLQLSPEQWARLDPDNTVPWLHVAADARDRHDTSGLAEAMFRVSRASRSDLRWGSVASLVIARLPAEMPVLDKVALAGEVLAAEAVLPPFVPLSQYCSVADVRDANRQQICAAAAEVLVNQGRSLVEVSLGAGIGQRVGWSEERLAALHDERDAIAQLRQQAPSPDGWSCPALESRLTLLTEMGQHGEVIAMRNALKQSPEPVAVLARKHREAAARRPAAGASGVASAVSQ